MTEKEEQRKYFNEWFSDLLLDQETCLFRDVLRNQKENLFEEWLRVHPVFTSVDIKEAKKEAHEMAIALGMKK